MKYWENVTVNGDFNGQVGRDSTGVENIISNFSTGNKNPEDKRIIDFWCNEWINDKEQTMNTFHKHTQSKS